MLGADEPRHYFLAVQTPAEERGTGGLIGNYGEITADKGRLSLTRFGRIGELNEFNVSVPRTLVAPPDYIERYARFAPQLQWLNVNLSPDFPTVAGVIAELYPQSGGQEVDGVIAVDPAGLAAILQLVGGVRVGSWPDLITSDNAVQILLRDQYNRFQYDDRVDFLGEVAQETWRRLTSGFLPSPQALVTALGPAVQGKHLLLAATRPSEEQVFDEMGAAGRMAPVNGDFLGVIVQNAAANKADAFLSRDIDYDVNLDPGSGRLEGVLKVVLRNDAPSSGLPDYVIGNTIDLPKGTNRMLLSVYTPWEILAATSDGQEVRLEDQRELGRRVFSTPVVIPPGTSVSLEFRLSGKMPRADIYRLDVHSQPAAGADQLRTSLSLSSGWRVDGGGRRATQSLPLDADRTLEVPLRRAGLFG
jgi:hypothetical protein